MILKTNNFLSALQIIMIALIAIFNVSITFASEAEYRLKEEQETPDPLFQTVTPKEKSTQVGDERIYLKHRNAKKIDTQITPDLLEQALDSEEGVEADTTLQDIFEAIKGGGEKSKEPLESSKKYEAPKDIENSPRLHEKAPSNSTNQLKPEKKQRNELITPDPLLDSM